MVLITGVSGRFPNSNSVSDFWGKLCNGEDLVSNSLDACYLQCNMSIVLVMNITAYGVFYIGCIECSYDRGLIQSSVIV
jgi:hypothetical protein